MKRPDAFHATTISMGNAHTTSMLLHATKIEEAAF